MRFLVLYLSLAAGLLHAEDFSFGTMLRAGLELPLLPIGDWEMTSGATSADLSRPKVDASPYYSNGGWQYFEIGYNGLQSFFRLYDGATATGHYISSVYTAVTPAVANATWTVSGTLTATTNLLGILKPYSEVALRNLSLGGGLSVVTNLASTSYNANQTGTAATMNTNIAPVVFRSNNTDGAWLLSGQVRFVGLSNYVLNGASGSQLQFGLNATSAPTPTPEPETWLMCAVALFIGGYRRPRRT